MYKRAIKAGGERYATYNLAQLICDLDPEKAAELYEMSKAAKE